MQLTFQHGPSTSCRPCIGRSQRLQFAAVNAPSPRPSLLARVSRRQGNENVAQASDKPQVDASRSFSVSLWTSPQEVTSDQCIPHPTCLSFRVWVQDPFEELESYHDNVVDRFFISYFAKKMSKQLGGMVVAITTAAACLFRTLFDSARSLPH